MHLWIFFLYFITTGNFGVIVIQSMSIDVQPSPVATVTEGSVLWLTCTYDLDGGTLGQLQWKVNDGGTVATVTPTSSTPCSTLSPDAYTPDCSQLSSNEVRLEILTPVHGDTYSCSVQLSDFTVIGQVSTQVDVVVPVPSVTFTSPVSDTVTVTPGGSQTYTCVTGSCRPQARIDWYKDGVNVTTRSGSVSSDGDRFVTTSTYTLTGAKGNSPATVQCRAINVNGMTPVQSNMKNFVVQWPPDGPPVISGYTNSSILYVNDTLSLSCRQTGGNPLSTLTWSGLCGGIPATDGSTGTESVSTIIITVTKGYNQGTCGCVSTHPQPQGQDRSEVTFTVHYPPSLPAITLMPTHPWLEGQNGTISCSYTEGFPTLTRIEWFRNSLLQIGQATPSITLTSLTKDDNRAGYTCRVNNAFTDVKLTNLMSSVKHLNVEYKPHMTLTPTTLTVAEGQTAQVTCDTEGNPAPKVEWLRGGTSLQKVPGTSLTLTLGNVNRSATDNYTCRAEGESSVQGRQLISEKNVYVLVQYPPDVTVVVPSTVKEGDTNVLLHCRTLGEPTTLTSQSWTQTINGTFITDQFTFETASMETIVLAEVSLADTGTYTCSASNGVLDRNGQILQSNRDSLNVKVHPRFNTIGQNDKFYGKLHTPVIVKIQFYSNPPVTTTVDLVWRKLTSGAVISPSSNITFRLTNETVHLIIKGKTVPFTGQAAVMTVASLDQDSVGNYTLTVKSDGKFSNTTFSINPSGPPEMPTNFQEIETTATSITVKWTKGFNGGHTQTFVILYGPEGGPNTEPLFAEEQHLDTYTKKITGLNPNTRYQLIIYAYNSEGNSSFSSDMNIIVETRENIKAPETSIAAIAGGVGGAIVFLLVITAVVVVLYRQRNIGRGSEGSVQKSDEALFNPDQNENEDGMKPNILYESAGPYRPELQQDENASGKPEYAIVEKKKTTVGAEYAEVIPKKDRKGKTVKIAESGDLYAEVQKNGKKKKETRKETKKGLDGKGKKKEIKMASHEQEQGTVYENINTVDGKSNELYANGIDESKTEKSTPDQQMPHRKKNQDGLVYLDVEFQDSQSGARKAVIHGIENKNEYALVDFTKQAALLPENNDDLSTKTD